MGAETVGFKEFQFIRVDGDDFELITSGDLEQSFYSSRVHGEISEVLRSIGIEGWFELIPYLSGWCLESLSPQQKEWLQEWLFEQPRQGLEFLSINKVLEVIRKKLPDKVEYLQSLMTCWNEGYYLLFDY